MKNKVSIYITLALVFLSIFFIFIIIRCSRPTFKIEIPYADKDIISEDSISSIKIFLETSLSMKGYVNRQHVSDSGYVIKTLVPVLITDCRDNLCQPELWTIRNAPQRYHNSEEEFRRNLRNGDLMGPGNTQIHKIIEYIISSNNKNEVSYLVSDCIPDLGSDNISVLDIITSTIYDCLSSHRNTAIAIFQYYSEFNGDYYYDFQNNTPYGGSHLTLNNRPLYLWIFGRHELIDLMIKNGLPSSRSVKFENCFYYRDEFKFNINYKILPYPKKGEFIIHEQDTAFEIYRLSDKSPISFCLGLNLNESPDFVKDIEYLKNNLKFKPDHLNKNNNFKVYDLDSIKSVAGFKKIASSIYANSLTHFIVFELKDLDPLIDTEFGLELAYNEPSWIRNAHIDDDSDVSEDDLQGKTFAFRYISRALNLRFDSDKKAIFSINFTLILK